MITQRQIAIYSKYKGNYVCFFQLASDTEKALIDDKQWNLIDDLYWCLSLLLVSNPSSDYRLKLDERLQQVCDTTETIGTLKNLVFSSD